MNDLNKKAFGGLIWFVIAMAGLLFLPAGTLKFWQAWVFLAVFSASVLAITLYLMKYDPQLLERRMHAGPAAEKEKSQKIIQAFAQVAFIATIAFPAVDRHFGWSTVSLYGVVVGDVLVSLGLLIVFFVFKENTYTSGVIEVEAGQRVISTGPYGFVRHPMYLGALIMLLGVPLALGSWWGLFAVIPFTLVLVWRLLQEEQFLEKRLAGYSDYQKQVKHRLVPFIW